MDWTEKQECVLCDKGGNLLVCSGDGCPISVHKSCMGCEANYDDAGNFHCPYCVYKQITAETSLLRERVMLNKKILSTFLEENIKDDNHQEPIVEMGDKDQEIASKDKLMDENNLVSDNVPNHGVGSEKHQQSEIPVPCDETRDTSVFEKTDVNTCMIMVIYDHVVDSVSYKGDRMKGDQLELDVSEGIKVEKQTGNDNGKFDEVFDRQQHTTFIEEEAQLKDAVLRSSLEKKITRKKRIRSVTSNKNGKRKKEEFVTEDLEDATEMLVSIHSRAQLQSKPNSKIDNDDLASLLDHPNAAKNLSLEAKTSGTSTTKTNDISNPKLKDSSKQVSVNDNDRSMILPLSSGKHRVFWSEEEEDMLKEGVQKFSSVTHKNLPWKKILDFGLHVFDPSRNPSDLKDKWRKLAKKN